MGWFNEDDGRPGRPGDGPAPRAERGRPPAPADDGRLAELHRLEAESKVRQAVETERLQAEYARVLALQQQEAELRIRASEEADRLQRVQSEQIQDYGRQQRAQQEEWLRHLERSRRIQDLTEENQVRFRALLDRWERLIERGERGAG